MKENFCMIKSTSRSCILIVLFLLIFSSCTMTKRRYTGGYHVEWNSIEMRHHRFEKDESQAEPLERNSLQANAGSNEEPISDVVANVELTIGEAATASTNASAVSATELTHTTSKHNRKPHQEKENVIFAESHDHAHDTQADPKPRIAPNEMTGIVWLDWTIAGLSLVGVVLLVIYYLRRWNFNAFWHPIAVAFTTNLWVTLLYILMFIVVAVLIWKAMNWLFKLAFPAD
jgi:hypothetical protein